MLARLSYLALLLLFLQPTLYGQSVRAVANTDSVSVGDVFEYRMILQQSQENDRIIYPDTALFPPTVELRNRQQFKISAFADSVVYHFQFFGYEDVLIPPLPVILIAGGDTAIVHTNAVTLSFKALVAEGDTSLKPLKPVFSFPRVWWPWLLAALLLAAFLIWWFKFREVPEPAPAAPVPEIIPFNDPHEELQRTLKAIKEQYPNLAMLRDFKPYYSDISDALRLYFERLYLIPALESTSRELLRYLDAYGVDEVMSDLTRRVLNKSDLVKFAKFTPTADDAIATYELAAEFLQRAEQADARRIARMKKKHDEQYGIKQEEA